MKVSVCCEIHYDFELEVPDDIETDDLVDFCDSNDPVYSEINKVCQKHNIDCWGDTWNIRNAETDEDLYFS